MNRYNTPHRQTGKELMYKIGIALAAVIVMVYFFPRDRQNSYQYELGRPWKYGQLIAAFDFPIYKEESVVKQEQDSVMQYFQPYAVYDVSVGAGQLKRLKDSYANGPLKMQLNAHYLEDITARLEQLYLQGIIDPNEVELLRGDSVSDVMMVKDNVASSVPSRRLLTPKEAYEQLVYADTSRYVRSVLQRCNLQDYLSPNVHYDKAKSDAAREELLSSVSWSSGVVVAGTKIVDRGEIIDREIHDILRSLDKALEERSGSLTQRRLTLAGQVLFAAMLMACFMMYLELFRRDYYDRRRTVLLLVMMVIFFSVLTSLMVGYNLLNVYIIPFAMAPIIVRVFMDSRTAFMLHMVMILFCSIVLRYPYEFILVQFIGGLVGIYSLRELSQRSQLLRTALLVTVVMMAFYLAYDLIHIDDLTKLNTNIYMSLAAQGVLLLFAYPLLFMLEKTFGFTSNVTLVELSNINHPLLRRLSEVAPGTFQHSLQVANIAAEAAREIGANSQLVRTGALYHDVGKLENAVFFTENQSGVNPHMSLTFTESARIIINHVADGVRLAEKYNLPKVIKDFICSHHGVGMAKYFYISEKNAHPDAEVDPAAFMYPGPNPLTKEEAILMMTDAVEAASRSLAEYTEESISQLVDKIVDTQVAEGAYKECPITFKDIEVVKGVFKEKLKTVYHTRISYPELKK